MGAGASAVSAAAGVPAPSFDDIGRWSKEEVAERVASLGSAFEPYQQLALDNGVDGTAVVVLTDKELKEIGVENDTHDDEVRQCAV